MPRNIAFLRGINLGKRRIKMDALRTLFLEMKFAEVETFIASGNVIFASKSTDLPTLETHIEAHLKQSLGYEVDTFLRACDLLPAIAALKAFPSFASENAGNTVHIGFLKEKLSVEQTRIFLSCRTNTDELHVSGREFYWLCKIKSHESKIWTSAQMKAVKLPTFSMRNITTVRKLAALFPSSAS